ncbi:50S ribosomal protein L11 methyltransferase [Kordiimonas sp. SCSIO 12610]|uniref:50S ribosomal protein L11 methyltransferase n=1 Tax=Kordiimonas sp. SCSIO 12610 TaxID=2829597 RepID=UPI00210D5693|nr:50S ribosomal protein L11 methyltransferase [Kordiimonas sp. SCSIO 12610]UTW55280.1 50S ribosomal protein L11 methyltransferase [Kordiimonas sp. SCSIO 12610]
MNFEPNDIIPLHNYKIGFDKRAVSLKILRSFIKGWYESAEVNLIKKVIKPDDRIIELGAGIGITAMVASNIVGDKISTYELNPYLIEWARDNFRRNGFNIPVNQVALMPESQINSDTVDFYVHDDFWSSSLTKPDVYTATLPTKVASVEKAISEQQANTLIVDIEGAEVDFFNHVELSGIEKIIMEIHYNIAGKAETDAMIMKLIAQGFALDLEKTGDRVLFLER